MPDAREDPPVRAFPIDIHPVCQLRGGHDRPLTAHVGRHMTVLVMFAALAMTPLAHAQTAPFAAACSDQVSQGLSNVGAWAEAQCAPDQAAAFAPVFAERCSAEEREGLRRVGGWAELQCAANEQLSSD
jgi:hypothetical protein